MKIKKEVVGVTLNFSVFLKQETSHNNNSRPERGIWADKLKDWSGAKGNVWD